MKIHIHNGSTALVFLGSVHTERSEWKFSLGLRPSISVDTNNLTEDTAQLFTIPLSQSLDVTVNEAYGWELWCSCATLITVCVYAVSDGMDQNQKSLY